MTVFAIERAGAALGRLFLRYTLLACLALVGAFLLSNYLEARYKLASLAQEEVYRLRLVAQILQISLEPVLADVRILAESEWLTDYLKTGAAADRTQLENHFFVIARHQPSYAQISYIDQNGLEGVRIDRLDGYPYRVPADQLKNQAEHAYVQQTLALKPGQLFISPVVMQHLDESPASPVLRLATPVKDKTGRPRGLVIVHYQAAHLLKVFAGAMAGSWGRPMLLNQEGHWLYSPDPQDAWKFIGQQGRRFQDRFPGVWNQIEAAEAGQIEAAKGAFMFRNFSPDSASPAATDRRLWHLVSHVPDSRLWPYLLQSMAGDLPTLTLFTVAALLVGSLLAWARSQELTSNERFRRLVELQPDAVLVTGDGRCVYANPAGLRLFGAIGLKAPIQGRPVLELIAPPFQETVRQWMEQAQRGEAVPSQELEIQRSNGERIPVELRATGIDYAGRPGLLVILRDISQRRRSEAALAEQRALLDAILRQAQDGIIACDLQGRLLFVNAAARRQARFDPRDQTLEISPDAWGAPHDVAGQPIPLQEWSLVKALRGEATVGREIRMVHADGQYYDLLMSATPLRKKDGTLLGAVATFSDITERRQAERLKEDLIDTIRRELRASEERFRVALKNAPLVVFNQDLELRYQWVDSPVRLTPEQVLGKRDVELLPRREDAERLEALKRRVLETGAGLRETVTMTLGDGEHSYDLTLEPLRDAGGAIVGLTGAAFDISERVHLEAQLREQARKLVEADRRKNDFLAMLGHELRNPLAPIRSAVDVLKLQNPLPPNVQWAVEMIDRQMNQITRLVDDLLDVARITRGRIELKKTPLELAEVVARAVETSQPLIQARHHTLTISLPQESLRVEADPVRLAQVVANLLHNAAKYTEEGGRITLRAWQEGAAAVLQVEDNGIGIPAPMLPSIFDLFTQVEQSLDRAQGGIGLGLTLVRSLVEMHGGSVTASSAGPGQGSTFTVRLPLAKTRLEPPAALPQTAANDAPPRRILLVEDNEAAAAALATLLRSLGHQVQTAADGEAALEILPALQPELVFLDIGLPGMDGYQVAQRIRRQPGAEAIPLIALTGYGRDQDIRRAREAGFDQHLLKPVSLERLRALFAAFQKPPRASEEGRAAAGL